VYKKYLTINGNKELRSVHNAIKKHGNDAKYHGYKQSNKHNDAKQEQTSEDSENHNAEETDHPHGGSDKTNTTKDSSSENTNTDDSNSDNHGTDDSSTVDVEDDTLDDILMEGFISKDEIDELQPEDITNIFDVQSENGDIKKNKTVDEIRACNNEIVEKMENFLDIMSGKQEAVEKLVDNINRTGVILSGDKQRSIFHKFQTAMHDINADKLRNCK
jgi:hypothetical protein